MYFLCFVVPHKRDDPKEHIDKLGAVHIDQFWLFYGGGPCKRTNGTNRTEGSTILKRLWGQKMFSFQGLGISNRTNPRNSEFARCPPAVSPPEQPHSFTHYRLKVVDVRAFGSWMSAPNVCSSKASRALTKVLTRDIRANDPPDVRGA